MEENEMYHRELAKQMPSCEIQLNSHAVNSQRLTMWLQGLLSLIK